MAKILLVEDDNNLREIYQARLVAEGYDIIAAQNGEEALVVAKQNKPDLIISDVMMPRISGFEMLDILRNTDGLKHTKVIMLTALGQAEDQQRAGNLGADKYLVKSQVTLEDIVNAAHELLAESGAEETPRPSEVPTESPQPTAEPTPSVPAPELSPAPVAPASPVPEPAPAEPVIPPATEPSPVAAPPAQATPPAAPVTTSPPAPEPSSDAAVPASVVPQPNTEVVVPPAPANPTPPTVTVVPADPMATVPTQAPVASPSAPATPAPATPPTPAADPAGPAAVVDATTQSLEKEEAELQAQIESYANQPAQAPLAVEPAPAEDTTSNDETIADAVEALNTPSEEPALQPPSVANAAPDATSVSPAPVPAPETVTPAPEPTSAATPAPSTNGSVDIPGKKVIQPLNSMEKPDLNELLAKEEAKGIMDTPPATPQADGATPSVPPTPPTAGMQPPAAPTDGGVPGQSFDPNKAL